MEVLRIIGDAADVDTKIECVVMMSLHSHVVIGREAV